MSHLESPTPIRTRLQHIKDNNSILDTPTKIIVTPKKTPIREFEKSLNILDNKNEKHIGKSPLSEQLLSKSTFMTPNKPSGSNITPIKKSISAQATPLKSALVTPSKQCEFVSLQAHLTKKSPSKPLYSPAANSLGSNIATIYQPSPTGNRIKPSRSILMSPYDHRKHKLENIDETIEVDSKPISRRKLNS